MTDMPDSAAAERIAQLRANIDEIDGQIVDLLNRRAECSLEIRKLKPVVHRGLYDPAREEEIFSNVAKKNKGPLYADNVREIYSAILHVMKEMQG